MTEHAPHLTPRETEIARLMAEGLSYSEIAVELRRTPDGIRATVWRMADRIGGRGSPFLRVVRWWFTRRQEAA